MEYSFNAALRRIRREKGLTQEQIADAVGVSPQAVSKWEGQSFPDAQLIPAIADALGVTTDELFGREREPEKSFCQQVTEHFRELAMKDRQASETMAQAFDCCRALISGMCGADEYSPLPESVLKNSEYATFSQLTLESGILQMRLTANLQYFLLMPEPEGGYDDLLHYDERMVRLFEFLAVPNALRAIYFLAGRSTTIFFKLETLTSELGISPDNARRIIDGLLEFNLIWEATLEGGKSSEKIYQYLADCTFPLLLAFTVTFLKRPSSFYYQTGARNSPYMKHDTYKEHKDEKDKTAD